MVRRLVQQQHRRLDEQRAAQRHFVFYIFKLGRSREKGEEFGLRSRQGRTTAREESGMGWRGWGLLHVCGNPFTLNEYAYSSTTQRNESAIQVYYTKYHNKNRTLDRTVLLQAAERLHARQPATYRDQRHTIQHTCPNDRLYAFDCSVG